jgi:hypothetical protein
MSLAACALPHGGGLADDAGDDATGDDVDPPPPPPSHPASAYHVTTDLDVSATTILPEPLYNAVEVMRTFETSPGEGLLDAAELAGVPAVDTLRAALPDILESQLTDWIDDRLAGTEFTVRVGQIVDLADTAFAHVELGSTLDVAAGTHALDTIAVEIAGSRAELAVEAPSGDLFALTADVDVTQDAVRHVTISGHTFGVHAGTAAWNALTAAVEAQYGTDLTTVVSTAVDCPGLAHAIATMCALGQCVGHESLLLSICTGAVDYAIDQVHDQFTSVDFDAVIFDAGQGTATDATFETIAGTWSAQLDLGAGPRAVPATFTATAE